MLREHKPPPIRRIRISDFRLPDPKRDPDRHQNCITWSLSHALPLQKISSKSVHKFASNPTDRQTHKQTNRPNQKHNFFGRGNYKIQDGLSNVGLRVGPIDLLRSTKTKPTAWQPELTQLGHMGNGLIQCT